MQRLHANLWRKKLTMKISRQAKVPPHAGEGTAKRSFPAIVAKTFGKFDIALRARLLGRLLGSVGPLALAVVGGGFFAKYVRHARRAEIPVTLEDASRATSSQVYELARYVEQSNPQLVEGLLTAASRNDVITPAADASIAATPLKRFQRTLRLRRK